MLHILRMGAFHCGNNSLQEGKRKEKALDGLLIGNGDIIYRFISLINRHVPGRYRGNGELQRWNRHRGFGRRHPEEDRSLLP